MADTNYYIDVGLASGDDDGSTPANAWKLMAAAGKCMLYASFNAATRNLVWIRRTSVHTMGADIALADDGTADKPILFIGWPRPAIPNTTITEGDWTNGSTQVDNVVGITLDREQHCGRYVTAPDGGQYQITRIGYNAAGGAVADMLLIDREYAGSTVTGTDGKFQIEADEDYANRPQAGIDAGWDADAIDLVMFDGNSDVGNIVGSGDNYYGIKNVIFKDTADANGMIYLSTGILFLLEGCILAFDDNALNNRFLDLRNIAILINRCILCGGGASQASQRLIQAQEAHLEINNSAIYNAGDNGLYLIDSPFTLNNVNIGIEAANIDADIYATGLINIKGVGVLFGGTNGDISFNDSFQTSIINIENYQKILGSHKTFFPGGEYISTAVSGETPNKKLSDTVLKITPNLTGYTYSEQDLKVKIPLGEINADAGSQTFKFWIYNGLGVTLNDGNALANFNLAAEYVSSYGDTTAYTMSIIRSAEHTIAVPADADDWDYLSVTPTIAIESKIRLWLEISVYSAAGNLIVDPQVVIT